jgi:hypothetical protein
MPEVMSRVKVIGVFDPYRMITWKHRGELVVREAVVEARRGTRRSWCLATAQGSSRSASIDDGQRFDFDPVGLGQRFDADDHVGRLVVAEDHDPRLRDDGQVPDAMPDHVDRRASPRERGERRQLRALGRRFDVSTSTARLMRDERRR